MSNKLKGLQYAAEQPAFLQRLRSGVAGPGERHERPIPRPKRAKTDDDDDAPAYVMEDTNESLSKEEYQKLVSGSNGDDAEDLATSKAADRNDREASAENPIMSGGLPSEDADSEQKDRPKANEAYLGQKKRKAATVIGKDDDDADAADEKPRPKKGKKKGKPIKLSFDDDEG
ncbi:hypothetical protein C1H76_8603 [Elsinoe australis]|uniref:DUF4604 domain-containing protein n=1 Tax=Elsinoe australis TaxID=40998 RepID=A0A4U7AQK4_9PEZI|nr:hypothetical protein C1H76_8603 [Elsinoe australis]